MKKVLPFVVVIFLFMSSLSYALPGPNCTKGTTPLCSNFHGSFIRITPPSTTFPDPFLDEFVFTKDGTVYFNESTAIGLPLERGTFLPFIGTWKGRDDIVKFTVISVIALPTVSEEDVTLYAWDRYTAKLRIVNKNKLEILHVINRQIPFGEDPLTAEGVVVGEAKGESVLKRIKVKSSDL